MTKILCSSLFAACAATAFAGDAGVSLTVGQPGYYGQIDIGNVPQPQVVYPQPVVIRQVPGVVSATPIYLHVPPGHEKHWREHCGEYSACGRPVYFVRDDWYRNEYVPRYRHGGHDHDEGDRHDEEEHGHREH